MNANFDTVGELAKDGEQRQFITFTVAEEEYGVPITTVREIRGWAEPSKLPNAPAFMRGVIDLRGVVVPIFDLRACFSEGVTEATSKHAIIILAIADRNIGILVDSVSDILTVNKGSIMPPPEVEQAADDKFIEGLISLDERMVVLLAIEKLFGGGLLQAAISSAEAA